MVGGIEEQKSDLVWIKGNTKWTQLTEKREPGGLEHSLVDKHRIWEVGMDVKSPSLPTLSILPQLQADRSITTLYTLSNSGSSYIRSVKYHR